MSVHPSSSLPSTSPTTVQLQARPPRRATCAAGSKNRVRNPPFHLTNFHSSLVIISYLFFCLYTLSWLGVPAASAPLILSCWFLFFFTWPWELLSQTCCFDRRSGILGVIDFVSLHFPFSLSSEVLRTWCNEAIYWHRRRRRMWGRRRGRRMGLVLFLFVLSLLLCSLSMVQRRLFIRLDFLMTKMTDMRIEWIVTGFFALHYFSLLAQ